MALAGRLRHRVVLEQRSSAAGTSGALQHSYAPVATAWGGIEAVRGSVYAAGLQTEERITHRIVLRWRDPTGFDHVRQDGTSHRFKVRDVRDPDGRRRELEIMAEEMTSP